MTEYRSDEEAVQCIKSGDRVFIHGSASTPVYLVKAMQDRYQELENAEPVSIKNAGVEPTSPPGRRNSYELCLNISKTISIELLLDAFP